MNHQPREHEEEIKIESLYPDFTEAELREAEETLDRYLDLVARIYERLRSNPETLPEVPVLTQS